MIHEREMRSDFYVYALFRENGTPFYIGKGAGTRWQHHESVARGGKKGHRFSIIRGMLIRGHELPKVKLHEGLTEAVAHQYEVALIAAIGRKAHGGPLVNETSGGEGAAGIPRSAANLAATIARCTGVPRTDEVRAKLAAARLGSKASLQTRAKMGATRTGAKHLPGTADKIAASLRGRPHTADRRSNISAAMKGKPNPEGVKRMADANRGRKISPETMAKRALTFATTIARRRKEKA
jgi:NUMOD3 motif